MRKTGIVKWFDARKGFGFILDEKKAEYFVHFSAIDGHGFKTLKENALVTFIPTDDGKGLKATDVKLNESSQ